MLSTPEKTLANTPLIINDILDEENRTIFLIQFESWDFAFGAGLEWLRSKYITGS